EGVRGTGPRLVAEVPREPLGLAGDGEHVVETSELEQRWTQLHPQIDRARERLTGLREPADGLQRGLERADRLRVRRPRDRPLADLLVVGLGLAPYFAAQRVVGELVDPAGEPVVVERLDRLNDPRVEDASLLPQQALVADVAGERGAERVLEVRKEPCLLEEPRPLQMGQATP